ncbi:MAG: hypothetical protein LBQ40_00145 [Clostridiales bacterium]|jgi:hypothetical protein|nr:hypothetical protein [Clostridiales bacterium]
MESKNLWVKVVVAAYRGVPTLVEALERFVDKAASNSYKNDCMSLFDVLSEKTARKSKLINLKCIADDAVAALKGDAQTIVKSRFDGVPFEEIAAGLGLNLRAVFRQYGGALDAMAYHMRIKGFDEEWFWEYFKDDAYISSLSEKIYNRAVSV